MAQTHWKKLINPDYIGAYALDPGKDLTVQISQVRREMVTGADGKKEECTVAYLKDQKPMILNVTNCKTIEKLYGPYMRIGMASISRFMQQRFVHLVMLLRRFGFVQRLRQLRHISVQTVDSQFRVQEAKAQRRLQRLESSSMEEHCASNVRERQWRR